MNGLMATGRAGSGRVPGPGFRGPGSAFRPSVRGRGGAPCEGIAVRTDAPALRRSVAPSLPRLRRGFSLAEMMIAIGILGIGMLMVAATFPVGIEQTRIATQETIIPLVVDDAANTMRLLLNSNQQRPFSLPSGMTGFAVPRTVLVDNVILPTTNGWSSPPGLTDRLSLSELKNKGDFTSLASNSFNDWLGAVRDYPAPPGVQPGPSQAAGLSGSPYTWFALSRYPADPSRLDVLFLVTRRSSASLAWARAERAAADTTGKTVRILGPASTADSTTAQALAALVGSGLSLACVDPNPLPLGQMRVLRVATVNTGTATLTLEEPATGVAPEGAGGSSVWIIPKDPATGVSPVIGWQVRSIPLN
ncbi:MAG: type IV pilus modification PilV family protein [Phycisphaerae bacterium]